MFHLSSFEQFSEKFKEVKDAARLAREKSQDKELANTALTIAAPQVSSGNAGLHRCRRKRQTFLNSAGQGRCNLIIGGNE